MPTKGVGPSPLTRVPVSKVSEGVGVSWSVRLVSSVVAFPKKTRLEGSGWPTAHIVPATQNPRNLFQTLVGRNSLRPSHTRS